MTSCELCQSNHPQMIWGNQWFYVIDVGNADYPAYIRIISRRHVPEMSNLTEQERTYLWRLLDAAEAAMIRYVAPDKVNYAQFGNMCPHLHWHLIGRWRDDPAFPDNTWLPKVREVAPEKTADRRAKTDEFIAALPAILSGVETPA